MIVKRKLYSNFKNGLAIASLIAAPIAASALTKAMKKRQNERISKEKEKTQEFIKNELKEINPKLLIALEIEDKVKAFHPGFGDGDEYPSFYVNKHTRYPEDFGRICLGYQNEESYKWNGKYWIEDNASYPPRRVMNLKQDIIPNLKAYKKEYQTADIDYGWTKEEVDKVERYLDKIIEEVQKSQL